MTVLLNSLDSLLFLLYFFPTLVMRRSVITIHVSGPRVMSRVVQSWHIPSGAFFLGG